MDETDDREGSSYNGGWKAGYFHGYGELTYSNGTVYKGYFHRGKRHGKGHIFWPRSGQTFQGSFFHGMKHGPGVHTSPKAEVRFEGFWHNGRINGNGTLIFTEPPKKGGKERRIMRGLWHKSEFAPTAEDGKSLNLSDLVAIVQKEDAAQTRQRATEYVQTHGTLLAAQLNDWCYQEKKRLRDERAEQLEDEAEAARQKIIDQKIAMKELREKRAEAKRKEAERGSSDEDESDSDG